MNRLKSILLLGLAAFAFGCPARSLFPLFAEKDLVALPALVGTWISVEGDSITIQAAEGKNYRATDRSARGQTTQGTAQVGKLGNAWFLDSSPMEKGVDHHFIPAHIISKIRIEGDSLFRFHYFSNCIS